LFAVDLLGKADKEAVIQRRKSHLSS